MLAFGQPMKPSVEKSGTVYDHKFKTVKTAAEQY